MLKKATVVFVAVLLVFAMSTAAFAAGTSLWTKTYKAEDGSILTITCLSEDEFGNYTINLDGKVFTEASYDGLTTYVCADGKPMRSSDGKLSFGYGQLYAPFVAPDGDYGYKSVGNEEGMLLQSDNDADTNFYLAKLDEKKNAEDSSAQWYKIIKTYRLIETKTKAVPTSSSVLINGKQVAFDAYNIGGNNYFKLRDLAMALNGSEKQFEVIWDNEKKVINLISGKEYTAVGGEMAKGDGSSKNAVLNTSSIYKDGEVASLTAYNINGNNYFKLRDVAQIFNFGVSWDGAANAVFIDTSKGYEAGDGR